MFDSILNFVLALVLSPIIPGVINRSKAFMAGRRGRPVFQLYFDLYKLLCKGVVYSRTTNLLFRACPIIGLSATLIAALIVPFAGTPALLSFEGDLILFAYMFGLMRFFAILAALDTGSSFEGMGASREAQFALFAEPALFLALAALAFQGNTFSLGGMFNMITINAWLKAAPGLALVSTALFVVLLAENCRVPVDDPDTHLELTMIHEVMVLDYSGPDLAYIEYAAALKMWLMGSLLICVIVPVRTQNHWLDLVAFVTGMIGLALVVGLVESSMARLRLLKIPRLLLGAATAAILALILQRSF